MKISHFKTMDKGAVKASFTVTLDKWANFQIRNITLMESGNKRWLTMPSRIYDDPNDQTKKKYFPYIGFESREVNDKFNAAIMLALDEHIKTLPAQETSNQQSVQKGTALEAFKEADDLPF